LGSGLNKRTPLSYSQALAQPFHEVGEIRSDFLDWMKREISLYISMWVLLECSPMIALFVVWWGLARK